MWSDKGNSFVVPFEDDHVRVMPGAKVVYLVRIHFQRDSKIIMRDLCLFGHGHMRVSLQTSDSEDGHAGLVPSGHA